ncbi:hypothetical protein CDAR_421581 [Caerostris darwini]|uniref:Uncharacterized protein n=1 Tax=Caerostris darwini TaxID=1538125 RepID=A0AAV4SYX7_9ARAC|nr:hypothetical protein CDAR_421581 [Caerostris darwini]
MDHFIYHCLLQRNSEVCPYHGEICNNKKSRPSFRPNAAACDTSLVVYGRISFMFGNMLLNFLFVLLWMGFHFERMRYQQSLRVHSDSQYRALETIRWPSFILNKPEREY